MNSLSFVSRMAAGQAQRSLKIRQFGSSSVLCSGSVHCRVKLSTEELSLKNRFLQAMVLSMTVNDHMSTEEDVKLYGYQRRATKGPLLKAVKKNSKINTENRLDQEKFTAWGQCSNMTEAESQEKYIDIMNSVRVRAGKDTI